MIEWEGEIAVALPLKILFQFTGCLLKFKGLVHLQEQIIPLSHNSDCGSENTWTR